MNQAGIGRAEAARVEVEGSKVGLEVDMQPLTAGGPRLTYRERDHCSADLGLTRSDGQGRCGVRLPGVGQVAG